MRSKMRWSAAASVTFVLACGGGGGTTHASSAEVSLPKADVSKGYPIRMARPSFVGQRMHLVSDAEENRTTKMTREGSVIDKKKDASHMHLDADLTVDSLDDKQDALRTTYAVNDLTSSGDHIKTVLHNQRVVLTRATKDDEATVLVDGTPATKEVREALRMVLSFRTGGPSDDEVFGTTQPQAIGAHWPINAQRAHDDLVADQGAGMASAQLSGDVTLVGLKRDGDVDCYELGSELHMDGLGIPEAPAGSTVEAGRATVKFSGLFPLDEKLQRRSDHLRLEMTMRLRVPAPNGGSILVEVDAFNKRDRQYTPL